MDDVTILNKSGRVECRICGLQFVPDLEEDREIHKSEHRRLVWGGLPLQVRELLKEFGWAVAHNDGGIDRLKGKWKPEIGKRAVVFSWWTRAVSRGVPENDFERFMAAHFAFVDAMVSGEEVRIKEAAKHVKPWEGYAG